jgi:hypothetical protein
MRRHELPKKEEVAIIYTCEDVNLIGECNLMQKHQLVLTACLGKKLALTKSIVNNLGCSRPMHDMRVLKFADTSCNAYFAKG